MLILQANQIQKSYGTKTVLDFSQLLVYEGDKIGIVGENGAGKSTLLGVLSREIELDSGTVAGDCQVAYIRQFSHNDPARSGGENAKRVIQGETAHAGQILFADEPTANLDSDGQKWVRQRLRGASTLLLVSHDRDLLDEICTKIILLKDGKLQEFTGNYTDYEAAVAVERAQHQLAYDQYQRKKNQLEAAVESKRKKENGMDKTPTRFGNSEARLGRYKMWSKKKKVERSRKMVEARLERLPEVEKLREPPALRIDYSLTHPPGNKNVITCKALSFGYEGKEVLRSVSFVVPNRAKIAITGKNGAGKTTLLNLIHQGHDAITTVPKLRMGYLYQSFEHLDMSKSVLDNVLATSIQDHAAVRSVLSGLLFFGDDVHKQASSLRGGEKMRLSLAKLLTCEANALLLDEPTNYLDLRAVEAVQQMLVQYPGTVLLVSHDTRFVQAVAGTLFQLDNGVLTQRPVQQEAKAASPAEKIMLELRLTKLVSEISSAPPEQKNLLEAQYHDTLEQLKLYK